MYPPPFLPYPDDRPFFLLFLTSFVIGDDFGGFFAFHRCGINDDTDEKLNYRIDFVSIL